MHPLIVIPARFGSVRLPGKPLLKINGEPLINLVVRNVLSFGLDAELVVATDDSRVEKAVAVVGVRSIQTSSEHRSGTERVAEIARTREFANIDLILNVQGDQPFLPKKAALGALKQIERGFPIGTAAGLLNRADEANRNRVKVTVDSVGRALQFSRDMLNLTDSGRTLGVFLHVGIYAYTRTALLNWVSLPITAAEREHGLEQLRPLMHETPIGVAVLHDTVEAGVDTPADLERTQSSVALSRTGI